MTETATSERNRLLNGSSPCSSLENVVLFAFDCLFVERTVRIEEEEEEGVLATFKEKMIYELKSNEANL